ncbi:sensor histidine kinase [Kitasatospora kifunensis]|uniref:Two-component system sensor histidine kinase DesK n=1 Tax=Kitasatospora kifunensis TaxID=58351 RepID=A0A7W7R349_KITKI|nr:sensor histidine kinase [Kitasatospora kifunensis]MBB4924535.1 two-component system sensor histidine kinase DesK [Kitasatospora kifunensis]
MGIGAWREYGKPKRIEIYIRWTFYAMTVVLPLSMLPFAGQNVIRQSATPAVALLCGLVLLSSALSVPLTRAALNYHVRGGALPVRLLLAHTAVIQAAVWLPLLAAAHRAVQPTALLLTGGVLLNLWVVAPAIVLRPRVLAPWALAMLVLALPPFWIACRNLGFAVGQLVGLTFGLTVCAASCRCSAWMVKVAWDLDSARETQARLAVAEERLRFSRDLHDVLGRNLTTMALKAELAVQLARRGRPEAADQMVEVQRIAQESQREVREVVRGYRTADLAAEVTGARSVLRAAGIECRIDLGPDPAALPALAQSVLGWVVREAATNVLRHSEAEQVTVRLWTHQEQAVLELSNDGVRPPVASEGGSGLAGLRERLAAHGGLLTCTRSPERFTLRATLPLPNTTPDQELAA